MAPAAEFGTDMDRVLLGRTKDMKELSVSIQVHKNNKVVKTDLPICPYYVEVAMMIKKLFHGSNSCVKSFYKKGF